MNGYKNPETYHLALWLHNDDYLNNELLPSLLSQAEGNKLLAGEMLENCFNEDADPAYQHSFIADVKGKDFYWKVRNEVGSLWRVKWQELFNGTEA